MESATFSVPELATYLGIGRNKAYELVNNNILTKSTSWQAN